MVYGGVSDVAAGASLRRCPPSSPPSGSVPGGRSGPRSSSTYPVFDQLRAVAVNLQPAERLAEDRACISACCARRRSGFRGAGAASRGSAAAARGHDAPAEGCRSLGPTKSGCRRRLPSVGSGRSGRPSLRRELQRLEQRAQEHGVGHRLWRFFELRAVGVDAGQRIPQAIIRASGEFGSNRCEQPHVREIAEGPLRGAGPQQHCSLPRGCGALNWPRSRRSGG